MNREVSPAVVIVATLVVLAIIGLIGIKVFGENSRPAPYVAGVKPPGLEQHANTPPGTRPMGEGQAVPQRGVPAKR
ncbi:MAG TPA: hypothetical protein VFB21_17310 [Chthonomonadaceae bacterium]|nr:hypothetical protein [Chthonomonadaceae bacterium]